MNGRAVTGRVRMTIAAGVVAPAQIYPMFEQALAHRDERTPDEQRIWLGELMARFTKNDRRESRNAQLGTVNGVVPTGNFLFRKNDGVTVSHTWTQNNTSLWDFRGGWQPTWQIVFLIPLFGLLWIAVSRANRSVIVADAGVIYLHRTLPRDLRAGLPAVSGTWGAFLEGSTIILIILPVLLPTAVALGIDPVHFGVMAVLNIMIGLVTPPFGLLLFLMGRIAEVPLKALVREVMPFLGVMIGALALVTLLPDLVLFLPRLLGYKG